MFICRCPFLFVNNRKGFLMPKHETVPSFESMEALQRGLAQKDRFEQCDLYPRDGQEVLGEAEETASRLIGTTPDQTLIFNNGMAAIDTAVEAALYHEGMEGESVIAVSAILYAQSGVRLQNYGRLGIDVAKFDSGCASNTQQILDKGPAVVFAETVGNGPGTPVLDHRLLLEATRDEECSPVIILDNTLPLSTGLPLAEQLNEDDKVIVVESGTKSYTQNAEISGIAYTKHPELLLALKTLRRDKGTIPGVGSTERIKLLLPESKRSFDARNKDLFKNTSILAHFLDEIANETKDFVVSNPALESHDNYELSKELNLPDGGSPVLFLQPTMLGMHVELATKLWSNPKVHEHAELGQSFGFDKTRILYDDRSGTVRIAGGSDTDAEALGEAFKEALCL